MNIFVLDTDISKCAQYHCDQHVVKMLLEYTQILSTALSCYKIPTKYKLTHINHPAVLWSIKSLSNWLWLQELTNELHEEFQYRYNNQHKSAIIAKSLPIPPINDLGLTLHPQIMPNEFKIIDNPVEGYRNFYKLRKSRFATWKKRSIPEWYLDKISN